MPIANLALIFAVLSLSQAGNLIRLCEANAISITFYRLFLAFLIVLPFSFSTFIKNKGLINKRLIITLAFMAIAFSSHFFAWITAIQKTKVANAAICFSINPIFTAIGARFFLKERISKNILIAIIAGIVGVTIIGSDDFSLSPEYFLGDMLAVLGGLLFSAHCLLGRTLRQNIPNMMIMTSIYFLGAILALIFACSINAPLANFNIKTETGIIALAVFPTILGHSSVIYAMKYFKAATVSAVLLLEPVLAGIVAYFAYNEALTLTTLAGYGLIAVGLLPLFYANTAISKRILKFKLFSPYTSDS